MKETYNLLIKKGQEFIKVYSMNKSEIYIGRHPANDIVLDDPLISRKHCRIFLKDEKLFVEDLNSTNGTFLNGKRVKTAELNEEDEIQIGIYNVILTRKRIHIDESTRQIFDIEKRLSYLLKEERERILHLQEMAMRDELTGLYTRRTLYQKFKEFLSKAEKIFIFFIDIDDFKKFNDEYGHSAGDLLLVFVARILRKIEDKGFVFRWGGEEFLIILPDVEKKEAREIAEEIKEEIKNKSEKQIRKKVTVSIGISFCENVDEIEEKIKIADKAMYLSKRKGKDRVEFLEK